MDRPWLQLFTRDWLDNSELRRCSPASRAILIDLMCLAHEGIPYGTLTDKVGPLTEDFLISRCIVSKAIFRKAIEELAKACRISRLGDGSLCVPRMVKDEEVRLKRAAGGALGGNPEIPRKVNLEVNLDLKEKGGGKVGGHSRAGTRADSDSDSDSDSSVVLSSSDSEQKNGVVLVTPNGQSSAWDQYILAFYAGGKKLSPVDIEDARQVWLDLSLGDQIGALDNARELAITRGDPDFIPFPLNHLRKKPWHRTGPGRMLPLPPKSEREAKRLQAERLFDERSINS